MVAVEGLALTFLSVGVSAQEYRGTMKIFGVLQTKKPNCTFNCGLPAAGAQVQIARDCQTIQSGKTVRNICPKPVTMFADKNGKFSDLMECSPYQLTATLGGKRFSNHAAPFCVNGRTNTDDWGTKVLN